QTAARGSAMCAELPLGGAPDRSRAAMARSSIGCRGRGAIGYDGCMTRYAVLLSIVLSAAPASAGRPAIRIDDFEDLDLEAATGLSWVALGDWLIGGGSTGALAVVRPSPGNRSRGALRVDGHLRAGAQTPFAGAWAALRADATGCDLTDYRALRFRVRG